MKKPTSVTLCSYSGGSTFLAAKAGTVNMLFRPAPVTWTAPGLGLLGEFFGGGSQYFSSSTAKNNATSGFVVQSSKRVGSP